MEKFKDLNQMISEAKRMANFFKAFERIPRVLELMQSSSGFVKGLEKTAGEKKKEIADLGVATVKALDGLSAVKDRIKEKGNELESLNDTMDMRKAGLIADMEVELNEIRKEQEAKLAVAVENMKLQVVVNEKAMNDSEVNMIEVINFHRSEIEKFGDIALDAEERADKALENLEKMKESLLGGD